MKGHKLCVRRKLKRKERKLKKIEALMIKMIDNINLGALCQVFFGIGFIEEKERKKIKEGQGNKRKARIKQGKVGSSSFNGNTCR